MKHTLRLTAAALALCLFTYGASAANSDVERAKAQIVAQLLDQQPEVDSRVADPEISGENPSQSVRELLSKLGPDGAWSDLNYADQARGDWSPARHLKRLFEMSVLYAKPGSPMHQDPALRDGIRLALGHWLEKNYKATNWWYNDIGVPTAMAGILMLMEKNISSDQLSAGLKIVGRSNISSTGQNRIWIASNQLRRGLLQNNTELTGVALDAILREICISWGEGIKADYSFHQHGPMLQLGNYGLSFAQDITAWADALRGTPWALPEEKLAVLRNYLLEGLRYVYWKQKMDINSCGRQLFPGSPANKFQVFVDVLKQMQRVDPEHAADYQAAIDSSSGVGPGSSWTAGKYFWDSDYMVDRRQSYFASVRMSSKRTDGFETTNKENQRGYHTADGALYVYIDGDEYTDIFPVWDWRKLPGITAAQVNEPIPTSIERNKSDFAGGVSDGRDGVAAFELAHGGVNAKKSWFFFNGRILCLGAGITSALDAPVVTTFNQSLARGTVTAQRNGDKPMTVGSRTEIPSLSWAWHDKIGYVFPTPANVTVGPARQTGNWKDIFITGPDAPVTKDIFSIWQDHGSKPSNANYACIVLPNTTSTQVGEYARNPDVRILANSSTLQAAQSQDLTMAVFYKPGELEYGPAKKVAVDVPCLVMLREEGSETTVFVADPTQALKTVNITLNGQRLSMQLPQGMYAGQSIKSKAGK